MTHYPHLIIGGGLAGISIASALHQRGETFLLLEAAPRLGGRLESLVTEDATFEYGPNSFSDKTPDILDLLRELNLTGDLLKPAPLAKKRYILKHGKIVMLPSSPPAILTTHALSWRGKLRFLSEFFYVRRQRDAHESVDQFFERHFGNEVARYFADPFVSGIFAGNPRDLVLKEAFPKMHDAEIEHGSLLRYLIREQKTGKASPVSHELKGGIDQIAKRAQAMWGNAIHLNEPVIQLLQSEDNTTERNALWHVTTSTHTYSATRVHVTVPAFCAAPLFDELSPELAKTLRAIDYPPVAVAHLRISKHEAYPFDGFGLLIPSTEKRNILGTLWNSSSFPELFADKAHHYITVYVGGATRRDILALNDDALTRTIIDEVSRLFSLREQPTLLHLKRHERAIPQYTETYRQAKAIILAESRLLRGLTLSGNYLGGISIPDTVAYARRGL